MNKTCCGLKVCFTTRNQCWLKIAEHTGSEDSLQQQIIQIVINHTSKKAKLLHSLNGPFDMNSDRSNGFGCYYILWQHLLSLCVKWWDVQTSTIGSQEVLNVEPLFRHDTVSELQQWQQTALNHNVLSEIEPSNSGETKVKAPSELIPTRDLNSCMVFVIGKPSTLL